LCDEDFFLAAQMASDVPDNERPKWTVDSDGKDVKVTFGEARGKVWMFAKAEVEDYRARIKRITGKEFGEIDINDIVGLYLGKGRPVIQLMVSALRITEEEAFHWLGTYCVQKHYRMSVEELYDDDDTRLDISDLMPKERYKAIWKLMGNTTVTDGRAKMYFWQKVSHYFSQ
jgi:hypothetical protein